MCSRRLVAPQPPRPGFLSFPFTPSSAAAKMPLPQTEASGPEPHRPQEPAEPHTPAQGARRASSEDAPGAGHEGSRPGLGTLRRAFSRASQRASVRAPRGDARLLRLSGRFLFGSLRRTPDNGPAGDQTGSTSEPGPACGRKGSSKAKEGVSRRSSTREGPAEAEGEGSPTPLTEQRRRRALRDSWVLLKGWQVSAGAVGGRVNPGLQAPVSALLLVTWRPLVRPPREAEASAPT